MVVINVEVNRRIISIHVDFMYVCMYTIESESNDALDGVIEALPSFNPFVKRKNMEGTRPILLFLLAILFHALLLTFFPFLFND